MSNDPKLAEKFAKLVVGELADIHALVLGIHDYIIADISEKTGSSVSEIENSMEIKRIARADRISADLLKRLGLL